MISETLRHRPDLARSNARSIAEILAIATPYPRQTVGRRSRFKTSLFVTALRPISAARRGRDLSQKPHSFILMHSTGAVGHVTTRCQHRACSLWSGFAKVPATTHYFTGCNRSSAHQISNRLRAANHRRQRPLGKTTSRSRRTVTKSMGARHFLSFWVRMGGGMTNSMTSVGHCVDIPHGTCAGGNDSFDDENELGLRHMYPFCSHSSSAVLSGQAIAASFHA
jgi:hypothetical protein